MPTLPFIRYIGIGMIKLYLFFLSRSIFLISLTVASQRRLIYNLFR